MKSCIITSHPSEEILRELESIFVFLFERKREFHREKNCIPSERVRFIERSSEIERNTCNPTFIVEIF